LPVWVLSEWAVLREDAMSSYMIARLADDGTDWVPVQCYRSYDAADAALDDMCDRMPHAWLEIIPAAGATGPELLLEMLECR
jgi:hypothetical protein